MTDALRELSDRYEIERVLGRGGMAVVHLAEERKHHRQVAIKILREDIGVSVGAECGRTETTDGSTMCSRFRMRWREPSSTRCGRRHSVKPSAGDASRN